MFVYIYIYKSSIYIYVCIHACIYIYKPCIHIYTYMYIYICIYVSRVYTVVTVLYNSMDDTASDQDGVVGGAQEGFEEATLRTASLQNGAAGDGPVQLTRTRILFGDVEGEDKVTRTVVAPKAARVQQRRKNEQGGAGKTGKSGGGARSQVGAAGQRSRPEPMGVGSGANGSEAERTSSASSGEGGRKRLSQSPTRSHTSPRVCVTITRM